MGAPRENNSLFVVRKPMTSKISTIKIAQQAMTTLLPVLGSPDQRLK
jgi:hypothetical protein